MTAPTDKELDDLVRRLRVQMAWQYLLAWLDLLRGKPWEE